MAEMIYLKYMLLETSEHNGGLTICDAGREPACGCGRGVQFEG